MDRRSAAMLGAAEPWLPVVVGFLTFLVASNLTHPVVFPDESAALTSANFFAGGGARSEWWYLPGYGLLLAPVLLITTSISSMYLGVHLVNAVLAAVTSFGLLRIDRSLFPERSLAVRALAGTIVALYPAYLYFASLAISDNVLVAGTVWTVVALVRVVDRPRTSHLIAQTVAVSSLLFVHSRAVPLLVAWVVVVVSMVASDRRSRTLVLGAGAVGCAVFTLLARISINYQRRTGLADLTRQSPSELLTDLLSLRALLVLPFTAMGQVMYLMLASLGLVVLGVVLLGKMARSGIDRREVVGRFVLLVLALSWFLSSIFTNQGQGDLAMYGRYMEAVLALPLFLGIASMLDTGIPRWFRRWMPTAIVLLSCFVVGIRGYDAFGGRNQMLNVSGVAIAQRITGDLDPAVFGIMAGVGSFGLALARSRNALLSASLLLLLFGANTAAVLQRATAFAGTLDEEIELLGPIAQLESTVCVGLDQAVLTDFTRQELYRINDLGRNYVFIDSVEIEEGATLPSCVGLVISERADLHESLAGWRSVAVEASRPQWLWVGPENLDLFDSVLPTDPGLPLRAPSADLEMAVEGSGVIREGGEAVALIRVTNTSDRAFVPALNLPEGAGGIRVGLEWRDPATPDVRLHEPERAQLPRILLPGESVVIEGELPTVVPSFEAGSGQWILRTEVVQELVAWFEDAGFDEQLVDIEEAE